MTDVDAFRALVEGAPAMLWLGDHDGHCIFLNRQLRDFWGVKGLDLSGFECGSTVHPDDRDALATPYMQAMADRTSFEVEARYRRFDGVYRIMKTAARPRFSSSGAFLGRAGVNTDVTEQQRAEEALRHSSEQLQLALDVSQGIATWVSDIRNDVLTADHRFSAMFGVDPARASQGLPFSVFVGAIVEEDREKVTAAVERAINSCGDYRVRKPGGDMRWLLAAGRCEAGNDGLASRFPGAVVDISDRKASEEQMELLTKELSHRIKNIFTVVQGMTSMAAREHPTARTALDALSGRFIAMAAAYACVAPSPDETAVSGSLLALLKVLFAPYVDDGVDRVRVEGPDVKVGPKTASDLALILHERATNAAKYGALRGDGVVRLQIRLGDRESCEFHWQESGGPQIATAPDTQGFGSRLIRSTVAALDGEMLTDWAPEDLRWTLTAPMEKLRL